MGHASFKVRTVFSSGEVYSHVFFKVAPFRGATVLIDRHGCQSTLYSLVPLTRTPHGLVNGTLKEIGVLNNPNLQ